MPLRKENNAPVYAHAFLLSFIITLWFMMAAAEPAFAQTNPVAVIRGGAICPDYGGLTAKFVNCIMSTVGWALDRYLGIMIQYFVTTVNAFCTLAVVVFGFFVFTGKAQPAGREAITLAVKIGFIIFFVNLGNYNALFPVLIDIVNWVTGLVTNYTAVQLSPFCPYSPFIWNRMDCVIDLLIGGILPGTSLASGIAGFMHAMLFSEGYGIAFFFVMLGIVVSTFLAVLQSMFILLSAYIAMALLSILSPVFIPMILFRATKPYFDKWLRMMIGVMLQPVFLIAYLALFLIALEVSLFTGQYSVYRAIACEAVESEGFKIGNYVMTNGQIQERAGASSPLSFVFGQSQTFGGNPTDGEVINNGAQGREIAKDAGEDGVKLFNSQGISVDVAVDGINIKHMAELCDMDPKSYVIRLMLSLFAALAVVYIFYTMLQVIPYLGNLISQDLFGIPSLASLVPQGSLSGSSLMNKLGFGKKGGV